jgi:hypothetical protein
MKKSEPCPFLEGLSFLLTIIAGAGPTAHVDDIFLAALAYANCYVIVKIKKSLHVNLVILR